LGYGKKPLNLTLDLQDSKQATLGNSSPQYRNQLSNSINARKDLNISLEIKPTSAELKFKLDSHKASKPAYQVSPKVSIGNWNEHNLQLHSVHNNSYQPEITSDRLKSSRFGNPGNLISAR